MGRRHCFQPFAIAGFLRAVGGATGGLGELAEGMRTGKGGWARMPCPGVGVPDNDHDARPRALAQEAASDNITGVWLPKYGKSVRGAVR
jgi:hypothetical protein